MRLGVTYWTALWIVESLILEIIVILFQFVSGSSELLLSGQGKGKAGVASYLQPLSWTAVSRNPSIPVVAILHTKLAFCIIHCRKTVCHTSCFCLQLRGRLHMLMSLKSDMVTWSSFF